MEEPYYVLTMNSTTKSRTWLENLTDVKKNKTISQVNPQNQSVYKHETHIKNY